MSSVLAHLGTPIHGFGDGLLHPLSGVDHLVAMLAIGVLAALATSKRAAWLTPMAFVGGMVVGGAAGMLGARVPGIDAAIALTVVALGVLITVRASRTTTWLPLIALAFGAVHGLAHGIEAPRSANVVAYVAGFVLATAVLHVGGALGGWSIRRATAARIASGALMAGAGVLMLIAA